MTMKTMIAIGLAAGLLCGTAARAADNVPTNYFAGYQFVAPALATNTVTDMGIATNVAYVLLPVTTLTDLTTNQAAEATGDIRAIIYGILQAFYVSYTASTNKTPSSIDRSTAYASDGTNTTETTVHSVRSARTVGSSTFP